MSGECCHDELHLRVRSEGPNQPQQRGNDSPLPARMKVAFDLIDQEDEATGRLHTQLRGDSLVLCPAPDEEIGERGDSASRRRRQHHGHVLTVAGANRGKVPRIVDAHAPRSGGAQQVTALGQGLQRSAKTLERQAVLELPDHPISNEAVARHLPASTGESLPNVVRLEAKHPGEIAVRQLLRGRYLSGLAVAKRVPEREAAIDARVEDQARVRRPPGPAGPRLIGRHEAALQRAPRALGLIAKGDGCLAPARNDILRRPHRVSSPRARQRPPRHVEQEALTWPVVSRDEIEPRGERHLHLGGRTYVLQVQVFKHLGKSRSNRELLRTQRKALVGR